MSDTPDNIIPFRSLKAAQPPSAESEERQRKMLHDWIEMQTDGEGCIVADGYDAAFIGLVDGGDCYQAVYDIYSCLYILQHRDGMDYEDAVEFFQFNVAGAYVGKGTPLFVRAWDRSAEVLP